MNIDRAEGAGRRTLGAERRERAPSFAKAMDGKAGQRTQNAELKKHGKCS
jgi:hypothetical protein